MTIEQNKSPPKHKIKPQIRKCFYCGLPMRNANVTKAECLSWLGVVRGQYRTALLLRYMRETEEHLLKRADGGTDARSNIVLAHQYCNSSRGDRTPEQHKKWIGKLLAEGAHPLGRLRDTIAKARGQQ
jgi:hypothetical protein